MTVRFISITTVQPEKEIFPNVRRIQLFQNIDIEAKECQHRHGITDGE
jgi:hypothetical protein